MAKDFSTMEDSNRSSNPSIHDISDPARRIVLRGGLAAAASGLLAPLAGLTPVAQAAGKAAAPTGPLLGFRSVAPSSADAVLVPPGYSVHVIAPWGEPVGVAGNMPSFRPDAANSAADQEAQVGLGQLAAHGVHAHQPLAAAEVQPGQRLIDRAPRLGLLVPCHAVLQVHDDAVHLQGDSLLDLAQRVAGHEEQRAAEWGVLAHGLVLTLVLTLGGSGITPQTSWRCARWTGRRCAAFYHRLWTHRK